jgi:hypothetical protein
MSSTPGDDDFRNDAPTRHLPIVVCPPTTAGSVSRRAAAPASARRGAGRFTLDVVVGVILKSFAISFVVRRTVVTGTPISSAVIETQSNSLGPAFQHVAPAGDHRVAKDRGHRFRRARTPLAKPRPSARVLAERNQNMSLIQRVGEVAMIEIRVVR